MKKMLPDGTMSEYIPGGVVAGPLSGLVDDSGPELVFDAKGNLELCADWLRNRKKAETIPFYNRQLIASLERQLETYQAIINGLTAQLEEAKKRPH